MREISDDQFIAAVEIIKRRESLLQSVADISAEIRRLTLLREDKRQEARNITNFVIADCVGLTKGIVDNISRNKYKRVYVLDRAFFNRKD
jgi:hypothetical protein